MKTHIISIEAPTLPSLPPTGYIVRYKRRFWQRWRYIIDDRRNIPRLFTTIDEAVKAVQEL